MVIKTSINLELIHCTNKKTKWILTRKRTVTFKERGFYKEGMLLG